MGNFNRNFNRDSRPGNSGRIFNRGTRDREMFQTTCSNCGKDCEVPFKPNGSKPVFCSDCFEKNGGETRRSNDRDYSRGRSNYERPQSFQTPQYNDRPQENARPQQNSDQFAALNAKLDRIITLLTPKPDYQNEAAEQPVQSEVSVPRAEKKVKSSRKPKAAPVEEVE